MVTVPCQVDSLHPDNHNGAKVVSIAGGEHYSLFLFDNGEVWGCGRNDAHELGLAADHPAQEGVRERSQELLKEKEERVAARQKKLEEVATKGDEEAVQKAEMELAEAQASLRVPLVEYVPEPVRVSQSLCRDSLVVFTSGWSADMKDLLPPSTRIVRSSPRVPSLLFTSREPHRRHRRRDEAQPCCLTLGPCLLLGLGQ